jgi:anti-sigma factor RsiW
MRDRLPDLLHERLDAAARALVEAHVGSCADCRAEIALLRETRVALTAGVRSVDIAAITRVVVDRTRTTVPSGRDSRRSSWRSSFRDWRVAASIALLVVGGGVVLSKVRYSGSQLSTIAPVESTATRTVAGSTSFAARPPVRHESTTSASSSSAELSAGGEVGDLSESDLRALLHDLNGMDAVPSTEPEPVVVRVSVPGSGGSE